MLASILVFICALRERVYSFSVEHNNHYFNRTYDEYTAIYRKNGSLCFWKHASPRGIKIRVMLRFLPYHLRKQSKGKPQFSNHRSFHYISFIISKVNCSVIGYWNSTYKINKWKKETCTEHNLEAEGNCKKKGYYLECKLPFIYIFFLAPLNVIN